MTLFFPLRCLSLPVLLCYWCLLTLLWKLASLQKPILTHTLHKILTLSLIIIKQGQIYLVGTSSITVISSSLQGPVWLRERGEVQTEGPTNDSDLLAAAKYQLNFKWSSNTCPPSTTSTLISQQGHLDTQAEPELQDTGRNSSLEGDSKTNIKGNLNQFISEVFP